MTDEGSIADDVVRMAVEKIRGVPLPQEWPAGALPAGARVRVVQDPAWSGPWMQVFTGTISRMAAPEAVVNCVARPGELAYWVEFDEPQLDHDAEGPYRKALIWERYLQAL